MGKFQLDVDEFIRTSEKRMVALVRQTTQETIDEAQTPVDKGGKMRVDTGFLRASGRLSLNNAPSGPDRPDTGKKYEADVDKTTELELGNFKLGDAVYFGWSASYARYREAYDGFLEAAVQNWPARVKRVAEEIRKRVNG